jgi:hypothetical protein
MGCSSALLLVQVTITHKQLTNTNHSKRNRHLTILINHRHRYYGSKSSKCQVFFAILQENQSITPQSTGHHRLRTGFVRFA